VLLDTELVLLRLDPDERAVIMTRTAQELPRELDAMRSFFRSLVHALGDLHRPSHRFIIDARDAVGRNDEAFETVKREFEEELFGGFCDVSVVLRTQIGKLQVQRYNEVLHEQSMQVYDDVADAMAADDRRTSELADG